MKLPALPCSLACLVGVILMAEFHVAYAEILSRNTPMIRVRVGAGTGVGTVIYEAGIPSELGSLSGVTAEPDTQSTNTIGGGSGEFTVRFVTDVNSRNGVGPPLEGTFSYDSSAPMICVTMTTCGSTPISFSEIRWETRDGDTLNDPPLRYDNTGNQVFQQQEDTNGATLGTNNRHRNWYRYFYDNDLLLPAGTYEGTVTISGEAN